MQPGHRDFLETADVAELPLYGAVVGLTSPGAVSLLGPAALVRDKPVTADVVELPLYGAVVGLTSPGAVSLLGLVALIQTVHRD